YVLGIRQQLPAVIPAAVRIAANRVALGEEDRVRATVGNGADAVDAPGLPVFAPAAAENVPVGGITDERPGSVIVARCPTTSRARQGWIARGLEDFNHGSVKPPAV